MYNRSLLTGAASSGLGNTWKFGGGACGEGRGFRQVSCHRAPSLKPTFSLGSCSRSVIMVEICRRLLPGRGQPLWYSRAAPGPGPKPWGRAFPLETAGRARRTGLVLARSGAFAAQCLLCGVSSSFGQEIIGVEEGQKPEQRRAAGLGGRQRKEARAKQGMFLS